MGDSSECNIKVICRVRPLNDSEEKTGSKFVLKFPTEESVNIAVSINSITTFFFLLKEGRMLYLNYNICSVIIVVTVKAVLMVDFSNYC